MENQIVTFFIDSYLGGFTFSNDPGKIAIESVETLIQNTNTDLHLTIEEIPYPTE